MEELNKGYEFTKAQIAELESLRAENERLKQIKSRNKSIELVVENQSLKTELEAARKDAEWQPIETAPKGERGYAWMYLAWGIDEDKNIGHGFHANGKFYAAATFFRCSGQRAFELREIEVTPTHWKPLPELPAIEQAKGGVK